MHRIFIGLLSLILLLAPASIYAEGQQLAAEKQAFVFEVENSSTGKTEELTVNTNLMEVKSPKIPKTTFINDGKNSGPFKEIRNNGVVFFANGEKSCSGAMIGPYTVLTARHCVFFKGPIRSLTNKLIPASFFAVWPGGYDSDTSIKVSYIITPKIPVQFIGLTNTTLALHLVDYSILVLEKPVGSQTGWFNVAKHSVSLGEPIVVMGFPGKKPTTHPWLSKGRVVELAPGSALSLFEHVFGNPYPYLPFSHNAKILLGSSGSPVFSTQKGEDTIIGVASSMFCPSSPDNALFSMASRGGMVDFVNKYRYATPHDVKLQMQQIIQQNFQLAQ